MDDNRTTWDGKPIAEDAPFGATIVVYRERAGKFEFLLLHRNHEGPNYEGDWAWTPPSGTRYPSEAIEQCAQRELMEETGLELKLHFVPGSVDEWPIFFARLDGNLDLVLSVEHARHQWAEVERALALCKPQAVADGIRLAGQTIHSRRRGDATRSADQGEENS